MSIYRHGVTPSSIKAERALTKPTYHMLQRFDNVKQKYVCYKAFDYRGNAIRLLKVLAYQIKYGNMRVMTCTMTWRAEKV